VRCDRVRRQCLPPCRPQTMRVTVRQDTPMQCHQWTMRLRHRVTRRPWLRLSRACDLYGVWISPIHVSDCVNG
jgi:hypothetical protein